MTLNVSAYPLCAARLKFQRADLSDKLMTHYWAAVCVAFDIRDAELAEAGGFNFESRTEENGKRLLSGLENLLMKRQQRVAANSAYASLELRASLGARGIKTSKLKTEDDYWLVAETLFAGRITRDGGLTRLYAQICNITKKERARLTAENLKKIDPDWLSDAAAHQRKLQ
ncbi:hypothetical protein G3A56_01595 [Rhizobium oryzihabitans]|uniref:Uncharacterized protein n=1 Tax=Rhizobium oryzihabitans TaxID=2267833 RepID=A0A7L5BDD7_9HYPH|nr:hypothetical protein [Rhizobium oryzihabitans]QIB36851.1 hypothetical protein G3A56_01595 [Rhizobium oryzihabitans]